MRFYVELDDTIKTLRKARGITQSQLARLTGVNKALISKYETGTCHPPYHTLIRLSKALGVSTDYLLGQKSNEDSMLSGLTETQIGTVVSIINEYKRLNAIALNKT